MIDVLIIGAGCAGLTAAIYAKRAGHSVVVLERLFHGGQISVTNEVENYPAIEKISGPELAGRIYEQAAALGADIRYEDVREASLAGPAKRVVTSTGVYEARTVIVANGVQRRKLGCPGEEKLLGRGVSYCATCDGALYRGRDVVVAGGGNTAAEDALYLSRFARRVVIVHRRDAFRAARALVDRMEKTANIDIVYDHVVESIAGGQKLEEVALRNVKTGSVRALAADGLFVAVGMEPKTELVRGQVELADGGYIRAGEDTRTSLPLVYAAGDIRTKPLRQVVCAAADGAVAASMAALDLGA